jgi:glycine/D-amino acid oxidase-like deaminating enzyme
MGMPEDDSEPVDPVPADWMFPAVVMEAASRLVPFWAAIADRLTAVEVNVSAGQYTVTADGRPILGGCAVAGLFFHAADNGWGIEGGPEAGRRLAAIVAGTLPDDASNAYRLDRPGIAAGAPRLVTY